MKRLAGSKILVVVLLAFAVLLISENSEAFDGKRKGFFFAFGLGPGLASYTQTTDSAGAEINKIEESKFAAFTNFNIGYAPSEQLAIYWMNKTSWVSILDTLDAEAPNDNQTYVMSVGGLGVTYYFSPQAPSLYISAGAGLAARALPFRGSDAWIGFGFAGGIGYEISKNWNLELSALYGSAKDDFPEINHEYKADAFSVGLTINVMPY